MIETKEKRQKKIRDDRKIARRRWEEEKEKAINLGLPMPKKPRTKAFQITLLARKVYVLLGYIHIIEIEQCSTINVQFHFSSHVVIAKMTKEDSKDPNMIGT